MNRHRPLPDCPSHGYHLLLCAAPAKPCRAVPSHAVPRRAMPCLVLVDECRRNTRLAATAGTSNPAAMHAQSAHALSSVREAVDVAESHSRQRQMWQAGVALPVDVVLDLLRHVVVDHMLDIGEVQPLRRHVGCNLRSRASAL